MSGCPFGNGLRDRRREKEVSDLLGGRRLEVPSTGPGGLGRRTVGVRVRNRCVVVSGNYRQLTFPLLPGGFLRDLPLTL